jgi:Uma2 family endonuclease
MVNIVTEPGHAPLVVRLRPIVSLSDDDFFQLCQDNRDLRLERSTQGEVLIMPPTGGETGRRSLRIAGQLDAWTEANGSGVAFDSSTGFVLPSGAIRSPDAAWMTRERWESIPSTARDHFVPLAPEFIIELRSPSDRLVDLHAKMHEYRAAGVGLGWLIDPIEHRVHVYSADAEITELDQPAQLPGDPVLPAFILDLQPVWGT